MAHSEVSICNLALSILGADGIRSFEENNKRARLSKNSYDAARDFLLAKYDWSFSRNLLELQQVAEDDPNVEVGIPDGYYLYKLPSDTIVPRDIWPRDSKLKWEVYGKYIMTTVDPVYLYYSRLVTDVGEFNQPFIEAVSYMIAARMAHPITQDVKLGREYKAEARQAIIESIALDANIGSEYRRLDENPDFDSFVNPGFGDDIRRGDSWPFTE